MRYSPDNTDGRLPKALKQLSQGTKDRLAEAFKTPDAEAFGTAIEEMEPSQRDELKHLLRRLKALAD